MKTGNPVVLPFSSMPSTHLLAVVVSGSSFPPSFPFISIYFQNTTFNTHFSIPSNTHHPNLPFFSIYLRISREYTIFASFPCIFPSNLGPYHPNHPSGIHDLSVITHIHNLLSPFRVALACMCLAVTPQNWGLIPEEEKKRLFLFPQQLLTAYSLPSRDRAL